MIQASNDLAQLLGAAGNAASRKGFDPTSRSFGAAFRAVIAQDAGSEPASATPRNLQALNTLKERLSTLQAALQPEDGTTLTSDQLQEIAQEIGAALTEFEAATGIDLRAGLEAFYTLASGNPIETAAPQPVTEDLVAGQSGLLALIDLAAAMGKAMLGTAAGETAPAAQAGAPTAQNQGVGREIMAPFTQSAGAAGATSETGARRNGPVRVAQTSVGELRMQAEATATVAKTTQISKASNIQLDEQTNGRVDIRTAIALALKGATAGKGGESMGQSAFDFTSAVANNQLVLQPGAGGLAPTDIARFSELLPREAQGLLSGVAEGGPVQDRATSNAEPSKPSRFNAAIAEQLRNAHVEEGLTKIELSPRGLGHIEIEVTTDTDGVTNVVVRAENSSVLNALREMRDPLTQMITMENGGSLSFEDTSAGSGNSNGQGQGGAGIDTTMSEGDGSSTATRGETIIIDGKQLDITT